MFPTTAEVIETVFRQSMGSYFYCSFEKGIHADMSTQAMIYADVVGALHILIKDEFRVLISHDQFGSHLTVDITMDSGVELRVKVTMDWSNQEVNTVHL